MSHDECARELGIVSERSKTNQGRIRDLEGEVDHLKISMAQVKLTVAGLVQDVSKFHSDLEARLAQLDAIIPTERPPAASTTPMPTWAKWLTGALIAAGAVVSAISWFLGLLPIPPP